MEKDLPTPNKWNLSPQLQKRVVYFHQNVLNIHMFQIDLEWQNSSARAPDKDWAPLCFLKK